MRLWIFLILLIGTVSCEWWGSEMSNDAGTSSNADGTVDNLIPFPGWVLGRDDIDETHQAFWDDCLHSTGCSVLCRDLIMDGSLDTCLFFPVSSPIDNGELDCREYDVGFCTRHSRFGEAECDGTSGRCFPQAISCEDDNNCPVYFSCDQGKCVETYHVASSFGVEWVTMFPPIDVTYWPCEGLGTCTYFEQCGNWVNVDDSVEPRCFFKYCDV